MKKETPQSPSEPSNVQKESPYSPQQLIGNAREAAEQSYSPYSRVRVGAALLLKTGEVIRGANIENRSFGLTNCAERSAIFAALSQGKKDFEALAIACPDSEYPLPPCGACRQVISEFVESDFPVLYSGRASEFIQTTMGDLLPADSLKELKHRKE